MSNQEINQQLLAALNAMKTAMVSGKGRLDALVLTREAIAAAEAEQQAPASEPVAWKCPCNVCMSPSACEEYCCAIEHGEQPAVPDGYALVPIEPTQEMMRAGASVPLNKAAINLDAVKGRHHSQIAMERLSKAAKAFKENDE